MRIGVPKEIKVLEGRVALVPAAMGELVNHGHTAFLETGAGEASGYADAEPMVGNLPELNQLLVLDAKYDGLIMGGSSVRWAVEVQEMAAQKEEMGTAMRGSAPGAREIPFTTDSEAARALCEEGEYLSDVGRNVQDHGAHGWMVGRHLGEEAGHQRPHGLGDDH